MFGGHSGDVGLPRIESQIENGNEQHGNALSKIRKEHGKAGWQYKYPYVSSSPFQHSSKHRGRCKSSTVTPVTYPTITK